jgi:hypothetical protein
MSSKPYTKEVGIKMSELVRLFFPAIQKNAVAQQPVTRPRPPQYEVPRSCGRGALGN